jgi:hypothetical protein
VIFLTALKENGFLMNTPLSLTLSRQGRGD